MKRVRNGNWRDGMPRGGHRPGAGKFCVYRHTVQCSEAADRQERALERRDRQEAKREIQRQLEGE